MSVSVKEKRIVPIGCAVLYALAALCVIIHLVCYLNADFADGFNMSVSAFLRGLFATVTGVLPFSLAETVLLCLPVGIVLLVILCVHTLRRADVRASTRLICILFSVLCALYSGFVLLFAPAYHGDSLEEKLGLEAKEVSAEQLASAACYFRDRAMELSDSITYSFGSFSHMPYTVDEMVDKLNDAYASVSERYGFVADLRAPVKSIAMSGPMTYTHISGVYTYYTGEANINVNFPDYTLPYTAAHEMSHQRGIAPENEANFMAFLVCEASEDAYIRYSGYMNMYEYLLNALYSADKARYADVWRDTDIRLRYEELEYSRFFSLYADSAAATVSGAVNDTYLKLQGQSDGSKSYGMVVDLAVAYVESITAGDTAA